MDQKIPGKSPIYCLYHSNRIKFYLILQKHYSLLILLIENKFSNYRSEHFPCTVYTNLPYIQEK